MTTTLQEEWLPFFLETGPHVLAVLALLAAVVSLRFILLRTVVERESVPMEDRRRLAVQIRNVLGFVFVLGLFFILANELRAFAVSLVAIAVAVVLATKELILCLSGTALRIGANAYTIGDRIEINGVRGNVIDQTFLATTILEIGPGHVTSQYSGRAIVFPNSLLLAHPLINETFMKEYIVHVMTFPLAVTDDWQRAERLLLEIADEECRPFLEKAARHMKKLEGKNWMDVPSVKPRVSIQIPEPGRINLLLRIPTPAHRTSRLEQVILRRFLLAFQGSAHT
ncbi:MAG TPA: mechanosensitive ion channel family protein [Nitrospiraceae bacterium]